MMTNTLASAPYSDVSYSAHRVVIEPSRGAGGRREITRTNAERLRVEIAEDVANGHRHFVLDCRHTNYIDVTGLGKLVSARKLIHDADGTLTIVGLNEDLLTLFRLTKLETLFTLITAAQWVASGGLS